MPPPAPAPRLLLFCGKDEELREIHLQDLRKRLPGPMEWERLDARQTSLPALLLHASSSMLFAAHRVLVASHADKLLKRGAKDNDPAALLQRFERAPGIQATLVLLTALPLRAARDLGAGAAVSCWPLQDREGYPDLTRWTSERARSLGKSLNAEASAALLARTGNSPAGILTALESLSLLVGEARDIPASAVEALVGSSPRHEPFQLADAICSGDSRRALDMLRGLLDSGERPESLCPILGFQFRRLAKGACLVEGGASPMQAAGSVGLPPSAAGPATAVWRRLPAGKMDAALKLLRDTERRLKSGGGQGRAAMERAVVRLCGLAGQGARPVPSRA